MQLQTQCEKKERATQCNPGGVQPNAIADPTWTGTVIGRAGLVSFGGALDPVIDSILACGAMWMEPRYLKDCALFTTFPGWCWPEQLLQYYAEVRENEGPRRKAGDWSGSGAPE